jgi:uncharacterized repeat protein (TIGR01451 family)
MSIIAALMVAGMSLCQGETLTLATTHRGWYRADGLNDPSNRNYLTGKLGSNPPNGGYRSFFGFDLTLVTNLIASAELQLQNPIFGYTSPDGAEILGIFDITTPFSTLTNGTGGIAAFDDLGSGLFLGSATVDDSMNYGYTVLVELNARGIAALNAARGGPVAVGASVVTLDGHNDEHIFSRSDASYFTGIKLQTLPNSALPDLQVSIIDSPQPVTVGELLTYQFAITNAGNLTANDVVLESAITSNALVFSVAVSQGSYSQNLNSVTCDLGQLSPGTNVTVKILVTPTSSGLVTNVAVVSQFGPDANPTNNSAIKTSLVVPLKFYSGPNLNIGRAYHTATLLADNRVLIIGGVTSTGQTATAELYNPVTKAFTLTGSMQRARAAHAATLLDDGTVLVTGISAGNQFGAEIYNPTSQTFSTISNTIYAHQDHTSTLLNDGRVLITGSSTYPYNATEVYFPLAHSFSNLTGSIYGGTKNQAIKLDDGRIILAGGTIGGAFGAVNSEIFNPATNVFTALPVLSRNRSYYGSAKLLDGRIIFAGGFNGGQQTADLFYTNTQAFAAVSNSMRWPHYFARANRLPGGQVLITGYSPQAELFDPATESFSRTAEMQVGRNYFTATTLSDGTVLIAGGLDAGSGGYLSSSEIYDSERVKPPPLININDVILAESDSGTNAMFQLNLSAPFGIPVSVAFATVEGSASQNIDFKSTNGVAIFPPGSTNILISVSVTGDRNYELNETFQLNLTDPSNAAIDDGSAVCTILNDDLSPTITVDSVSIKEGNTYSNLLTFSLSMSGASYLPVWVNYFTSNGTAQAGNDYIATNSGVTFAPGVTNRFIQVVVWSDILAEPHETFHLYLPDSVNGTLLTNHVTATIENDDGIPGVPSSFIFSSVPSPQYLRTPFPLTVTAKDAFGDTVTNYAGGAMLWASATNATASVFDFAEGNFSQWTPLNPPQTPGPYQIVPFDVSGHGCPSLAFRLAADWNAPDGISRPVTLSGGTTYAFWADIAAFNENGSSANLTPGQVGIMINNQILTNFDFGTFGYIYPLQTFRTNLLTTYTAPTNGTYQLTIRFTRSVPQSSVWNYVDNVRITPATVPPRWIAAFTNGVWTAQIDPTTTASGLQFLAQSPEGYSGSGNTFDVLPRAELALSGTNSPSVVRAGSDVVFTFSVTNRGPSNATNVVLTNFLANAITFRSAVLSQGSYTHSNGVVVCNLGNMTNGQRSTISITAKPYVPGVTTNLAIVASSVFDSDAADNAVVIPVTANLPLLHVDNLSVTEGNFGTNNSQLSLWLEGPIGIPLSLDYSTAEGTAHSGSDYVAVSGALTFAIGVTNLTVSMPILGDLTWEPTETLALTLTNLSNSVATQSQATNTILDNDSVPAISIGDVSLTEGGSGTSPAQFPVTLSNPSSVQIQVYCRTTNGTATFPNDYLNTIATLIFPPGATNQTFSVPIIGDTNNEFDQTFLAVLSLPVSASIARGTATGIIVNDDAAPGKLLRFAFDPIASPQIMNQPFPVTIHALDHLNQPANFTGTAVLVAETNEFVVPFARDDFEDGDLAGWTNFATPSLQFSNVTDNAATGTHSLRLAGKAASTIYTSSLRYSFTNCNPNHVRFNVRAAQTNAITGRVWLVGGSGYRAFDFYLNKDGRMGLSTSQGFIGVNYQSNHWYAVDVELDWATKKVNCRIDGGLVVTNSAFPDSSATSANYIAVQNSEIGVSWFDAFQVATTYFTNLTVAPSNLAGFVSGVWTGNVTVQSPATDVRLIVNDSLEHLGSSGLFDVIAPEVIRIVQIQPLLNGTLQMSVEGLVGETYTLWTSTNLNNWVSVQNFVCTNSPTMVTDSSSQNDQQRFYRITRQPTSP